MAAISKLIENCNCANDLIHSNGCFVNATQNLPRFFISNAKYFLPFVFMPLLLKIKKINRNKITDAFKYYMEVIYCGTITGWMISILICVIRQIYGKFGPYSSFFVPSLCGAAFTFLTATPRVRRLFSTAIVQAQIASLIGDRKNILTKLLADSIVIKTLSFMGCSALIMHAKRHGKYPGFWFLQHNALSSKIIESTVEEIKLRQDCPEGQNQENITAHSTLCTHVGRNCYQHFTVGVRLYIAIGLTLDAAKVLISSQPAQARGFLNVLKAKLSTFSLQSTAFLATYIGIYRFTHCYLNYKTESNRELNHILASFLGGASFLLCPKLELQSLGIVLCMEILWKMFHTYKFEKHFDLLQQLKRFPLAHILFTFSLAKVIDSYVAEPGHVNSLGAIIINNITDNYAKRIKFNISQRMQSLSQ